MEQQQKHGWRSGLTLTSHLCEPGLIAILVVSCGLSFLLVLALFQGFSPSIKTNTSKFQFGLDEGYRFVSVHTFNFFNK